VTTDAENETSARIFCVISRNFCALVEEHAALTCAEFLDRVHAQLPRLYSGALLLPEVDWHAADCEGHHSKRSLTLVLREKLGDADLYLEIFDPYGRTVESPVIGSLSDDIEDIYAELVSGLQCWEAGNQGGALWSWKFGFRWHWGEHVTGALRALHSRAFRHDMDVRSIDTREA